MTWIDAAGYLASILVFATFCMRTMIPLRVTAIVSNISFVVYGFFGHVYPVLILHLILLPMNTWRTIEMVRLVRRVEEAAKGDLNLEWLRPFMMSAHFAAGHVLFRRHDSADRLFVILKGEIVLEEIGQVLKAGDVLGEIALFSAERQRTQTARCLSDVDVLWVAEDHLAQICYQNPAVSFHLLRLITGRLIAHIARYESENIAATNS